MNLARPIKQIDGNTLGLAGFGNIPRMIVRKLAPRKLKILVHDPFVNDEILIEFGVQRARLEEILDRSDYVSVHVLMTLQAHKLFNYKVFIRMRREAIFMNTARGLLVDEEGLYRALKEGWIAEAGIDVMVKEPPQSDHPLFELPSLTVSPHFAFYSEESCVDSQRMAA